MTMFTTAELAATRAALASAVRRTPVADWPGGDRVVLKLELWQLAGCFKTRGVTLHLASLDAAARARGVIAASAGNHAAAVSVAARALGVPATVIVPRSASPARLAICRDHGAEVVLVDDIAAAFTELERRAQDGRTVVHSFDTPWMLRGAADLAAELVEQTAPLDAGIAAIGGGALGGGLAAGLQPPRRSASRAPRSRTASPRRTRASARSTSAAASSVGSSRCPTPRSSRPCASCFTPRSWPSSPLRRPRWRRCAVRCATSSRASASG
jgi:threonine dehydratase